VTFQGGLIQLIARRKNGQQVRAREGLSLGFLSFLPLLEYRLFVQTFSIVSCFSLFATTIRNFGWEVLNFMIPLSIFVLIVALILALFFTYTEFYIVIDDNGVFTAISKSIRLVIQNLEETLLLTILMLIIGVRIIIQLLFVLLIPVIALGAVYLLTAANLPNLGILMGVILGVGGLMVASYLNGIIHVFAMTVWTFTFLKLTTQAKPSARDIEKNQASP
jgi:hypothetical protein